MRINVLAAAQDTNDPPEPEGPWLPRRMVIMWKGKYWDLCQQNTHSSRSPKARSMLKHLILLCLTDIPASRQTQPVAWPKKCFKNTSTHSLTKGPQGVYYLKSTSGTSLVLQWLGLCASNAGEDRVFSPWSGKKGSTCKDMPPPKKKKEKEKYSAIIYFQ